MFRCVAYTDAMKDEWDRFAWSKGTVFHTTAFRQILVSSFGYKCKYHVILNEQNRICAIIPLIAGRNLGLKKVGVSLPFVNYTDICADSEESFKFTLDSLIKLKDKYRLNYIELRLKDQNLDSSEWSLNLHNHTFVLSLSDNEEEVLSQSTGSNRNHVRKVYKNNWFSVSFDTAHMEAFYKVYVKRMKQLGSPAQDIRFFKSFLEYLPEHAFLLSVLDNQTGEVVGGMLLLASPSNSTLYYPYGANLSEYNNKYLNNFMYWEAVRLGIRNGLKFLDLGRSQTGSGTYKYKEQWGAKPEQLKYLVYNGSGKESGPPDRESLSFFVQLWKVTPSFITDRVGKQLIKYLLP
ncbi:GNAT family N-acetyltransferase [Paenibacillus radicis (ex Xue et al. 2023)]|uniref:GNAT family N-acetyltransferase n=1 Tax=Paenibacillus radicis (ex Xue et al. 2023) TaxID=2972489 RepID=A0ABT1YUX3_9BACL|nr:GNAT family N-acetyltransferase [Paenibacillus radicis (ex Xue et al. 2023)]MCR8636747.1 GNAT family N-acetyltransferase [Paenibacillus radicis (ex Xue et al. 2023)]